MCGEKRKTEGYRLGVLSHQRLNRIPVGQGSEQPVEQHELWPLFSYLHRLKFRLLLVYQPKRFGAAELGEGVFDELENAFSHLGLINREQTSLHYFSFLG